MSATSIMPATSSSSPNSPTAPRLKAYATASGASAGARGTRRPADRALSGRLSDLRRPAHDRFVHLRESAMPRRFWQRHAERRGGRSPAARRQARAGPDHAAAGSQGRQARIRARFAVCGHLFGRDDAYAGRGDRAGARGNEGVRCRLPRLARRRIDHGLRQGARLAHRRQPALHSHHLCRLRDDADPRRDQGRPEDHGAHQRRAAGNRDLRRRPHAVAAGRPSPRRPASTPSRMRWKRSMRATAIP